MRRRRGNGSTRRIAVVATAVCVGAGASVAAASTSGIASKSPTAILAASESAMVSVSTIHVAGTGDVSGAQMTLDLRLVAGKGGEGTIDLGGAGLQYVVIGSEAYFKANAAFWKKYSSASVAKLIGGRWLKAPASGQLASFAKFGSLQAVATAILGTHGALTKSSSPTTIRGQKVIGVTDRSNGGTLYVAASGKPYPVEIANGSKHDVILFSQINQPVTLTAPSGALDISKLG